MKEQDQARKNGSTPLRIAILVVVGFGSTIALIFLPAGRLDWFEGWVYLGLLLLGWLATMIGMRLKQPGLIAQRMHAGEGTKKWDRPILGLMRLAMFGSIIAAGLEVVRYGGEPLPMWAFGAGVALIMVGNVIMTWAMTCNAHFEGTVRIQRDRDHKVIDSGPYRLVRHPGYVGFLMLLGSAPLILRSSWAILPTVVALALLVLRTALEDATLRRELEGYDAFARRVRARLIPGIW